MSSKTYDLLKWIITVVLPAFGALYVTLASLWGLPAAEAVAGTVAALGTFGGVFLVYKSKAYFADSGPTDAAYDGEMVIATDEAGEDPNKPVVMLNLSTSAPDLYDKDSITLKVRSQ